MPLEYCRKHRKCDFEFINEGCASAILPLRKPLVRIDPGEGSNIFVTHESGKFNVTLHLAIVDIVIRALRRHCGACCAILVVKCQGFLLCKIALYGSDIKDLSFSRVRSCNETCNLATRQALSP